MIRSVEKVPDKLLPENLRQTFALDWVDDEYSGQRPYSALIVPPLAEAAGIPHAHPVIGVLVADGSLRIFSKQYAGRIVLLEEREPSGKSENTSNMLKQLTESSNNRIDGVEFLRARMLDLLIGDWDRHEDQWRWTNNKTGKDKIFAAVPRDRDQVFHVTEGLIPSIAALPWIDPILGNFDSTIPQIKYSIFKTKFGQPYLNVQLNYSDWMKIVDDFVRRENDHVLEGSLKCLPKPIYDLRHKELLSKLKKRRDNIPAAMSEYYKFIYRIVDIRLSDNDEQVSITDTAVSSLRITVKKLKSSGKPGETIMNMVYDPKITQDIRLYTEAGNDKVLINNTTSPIRLRIVDSTGSKTIDIKKSRNMVTVYGPKNKDSTNYLGERNRVIIKMSEDSDNISFYPTNHYNLWMPLMTAAINRDDGFLLGAGFRYTGRDGFRKTPYTTIQELMITRSFETNAFRINYEGQWKEVVGKADFVLKGLADAPDNTMNFFGQGNGTVLDKSGDYKKFYRASFDLYQVDPSLRWHTGIKSIISFGPSLQYYHLNQEDNAGRSITQPGLIKSYDSISYSSNKAQIGLITNFVSNTRNNNTLPTKGYLLDINIHGYTGFNGNSKAFLQFKPEFTYYQKIDTGSVLVFSDRIGGGISLGNPAFYQSLFLGGQGNLLGHLQNRFAGQQMVFNNFQARLRLANVAGYILPG